MPNFEDPQYQTVAEQAIVALMALIADMRDPDIPLSSGDPGYPGFSKLFKNVFRGDPDDNPQWTALQCPFVAVEDGDNAITGQQIPMVVNREIVIYVHVRFARGQQGVDPYKVFNYYLGRLQNTILTNYRLGDPPVVRDINETASAPQIFREDNMQGGYLALSARLAHVRENPYVLR